MLNVPEWSDTLQKSCSKCYKIFKVCLTILVRFILNGYTFLQDCRIVQTIETKVNNGLEWDMLKLKRIVPYLVKSFHKTFLHHLTM